MKWVTGFARNTPLGLGDATGGQPGALLAPRPRGRRILRFPAKRKSLLALQLVLFPPNPLTLGFGGSCGNFPGFVGKSPQIAPKVETRRRIPVQRRAILSDRYGSICRDFRDRAGKSTASTLPHTCRQRHIRDTSGTEQRQNRFAAAHEPQMYQCFPRLPPRLYRLPHIFSLCCVCDLLHHVLSQTEQSHFLFADSNLFGVLTGRRFNEAFLCQHLLQALL